MQKTATVWMGGLIALVALMVATLALLATPAQASVRFDYFTGQQNSTSVTLEWATVTELKIAGFRVYRLAEGSTAPEPVSSFIAARGDSFTGATYRFTDPTGDANTYAYYIQAVNLDTSTEMVGPVRIVSLEADTTLWLPIVVR
ncbi:MAG: hypothetical protein HC876_20035 [Chloroflexaceae bacterium]|nr:hypothetical protein [Chloroflexaceae bacterium]NJO07616.1 hypothetical protein [Chloroflexaceae bacterium]